MKSLSHCALTVIIASLSLSGVCHAAVVPVITENGVRRDASLDWSALLDGGLFPSPLIVAASGSPGLTASVSKGAIPFSKFLSGPDPGANFVGNFAVGEPLLWARGNDAAASFEFNVPVAGFGAQLQSSLHGDFMATIEAFAADGTSLGTFDQAGLSDGALDDSAIFLGVRSSLNEIKRVALDITGTANPHDFWLNSPSIEVAVPEPSTGILAVAGLVGFALLTKRRTLKCESAAAPRSDVIHIR